VPVLFRRPVRPASPAGVNDDHARPNRL